MDMTAAIDVAKTDPSPAQPDRREVGARAERWFDLSGRLFVAVFVLVFTIGLLVAIAVIVQVRRDWLSERLNAATIAAIAVEFAPVGSPQEDRIRLLLDTLGARAIAVETVGVRRLIGSVAEADAGSRKLHIGVEGVAAATAAAGTLVFDGSMRTLWVVGHGSARHTSAVEDRPAPRAQLPRVEVLVDETEMRSSMIDVAVQLVVAALLSALAIAGLVSVVVTRRVSRPVRRLMANVGAFASDPEGIGRNIVPSQRKDEIGRAEIALAQMQGALAGELRERRRLAGLGLSVSKINHELRNLLTTAQLLGDRLEGVADPVVQRVAPRLIATLDRAIRFCEATLAYGRATEPFPQRRHVLLAPILSEMEDLAGLSHDSRIAIRTRAEAGLTVFVDPEQFSRALINIVRNAVQALDAAGTQEVSPLVTVTARRDGGRVVILIADNGPGLPESARATLFAPFQGSMRAGGSGLGLAIASELVHLNGATLGLDEGTTGACFRIVIPDSYASGEGDAKVA